MCGEARIEVVPTKASTVVPLTRNMVSKTGLSIAEDAQEEEFVVIEVTGAECVPWLVCSIVDDKLDEATNVIESLGALICMIIGWDLWSQATSL